MRPLEGGALAPISPEGIVPRRLVPSPDGLRAASIREGGEVHVYGPDGEQPTGARFEPGEVAFGWQDDDWLLVGARIVPVAPIAAVRLSTGERRPWAKVMPAAAGLNTIISVWSAAGGERLFYSYASFAAQLFEATGVR
jgi:hypothetical protein